jgi:hypothetical protein
MAHKTMVDGTNYEIKGGRTLVNGTAYSIKNGKTLVDGTAYEVGFAKPATITISFTRQGSAKFYTYASVTIDGVSYPTVDNQLNLPTEEIIVPIGAIITCKVVGNIGTPKITLNGTTVASGNNSEYRYTVVGNATIAANISQSFTPQTGTQPYGTIAITEQ